jgi:hypothetical protein
VCTAEFDQSMTANGQTMGPFKMRATLVAERHNDHWIWVHWHGSMRENPQVAQAAAPAAPADATPVPAPAAAPPAAAPASTPASAMPAPAH